VLTKGSRRDGTAGALKGNFMPRKRLLSRVNYDNTQFEIGDDIDIRDEDLPQLEAAGAIADAPDEAGTETTTHKVRR
jgi:hypothetical protein